MIVFKMKGGLGNQLFQFAAGLAMMKRTSMPVFYDTTHYEKQSFRPLIIEKLGIKLDRPEKQALDLLTGGQGLKGKILRGFSRRFGWPLRHMITEIETKFDRRILTPSYGAYFDGYWQSEEYFYEVKEDFQNLLKPTFEHDVSMMSTLNQMRACKFPVAIHVRRGDYLNKENASIFRVLGMDYYAAAHDCLLNSTGIRPDYFIFSEDKEWCKENFGEAARIVSLQGLNKDLDEFLLMSKFDYIITANSTFSWWAAWLGSSTKKCIVTPASWFVERSSREQRLLPASWIKI